MPGKITEASTFAIDEQVYGEAFSGVAEVAVYLLLGNGARTLLGKSKGIPRRLAPMLSMN